MAESHPRGARLALAFVLLSLLALVVVPVLVQRRIDALRDRVELVVEPARENVTTIQYFLARQMSEEFQRLDPTGPAGHGLGLAISRRLAQLLRGRITVESEPPDGSVFSLWLPLRAQEDGGGEAEPR